MRIKGVGIARTNKALMDYSKQIEGMWTLKDWLYATLDTKQQMGLNDVNEHIEELKYKNLDVKYNCVLDETYPHSLRSLLKSNTPPMLSMIGNVDLLKQKKIGFSGSRKVSEKGIMITQDCVEQLVHIPDLCIVSGYAQGVDNVAHYTALKEGGNTIAVLPTGIKDFHIRRDLQKVWDWNRVLVISEYLPEDGWTVSRAMNRNMTIIGLCDAMIVVEAGLTGGSLNAGEKTLQEKKPLFVPQYENYPESALGNRLLLEKGAHTIRRSATKNRANLSSFYYYI